MMMNNASQHSQFIALSLSAAILLSVSFFTSASAGTQSVELGLTELSPNGLSGGKIIPASCPSNLHDEPSYGQGCSIAYACGTTGGAIQCGGACSAPNPNPPNYGGGCSTANICGTANSGTVTCSGACSATEPPLPANYGFSCTGPTNSCGMRNFGSIGCTNNCSAQFPPPESQCQNLNATTTTGITLTAAPQVTGLNGFSDLSWQSTGGSCILYNSTTGDVIATSTAGTFRVGPISSVRRYVLTCGNQSVSVTVRPDIGFQEF